MTGNEMADPGTTPKRKTAHRPLWTRSLRFRLTLWYTGVLGVLLLLAAALLYTGAQRTLQTETDAFLASETQRLAAAAAGDPDDHPDIHDLQEAVTSRRLSSQRGNAAGAPSAAAPPGGSGDLLQFDIVYARFLRRSDSRALAVSPELAAQPALLTSLDPLLRKPASAGGRFAFAAPTEEQRMRVLTTPVRIGSQEGMLQVAVPWDHNADVLERLGALLAAGLPVIVLLAAGGGWILVGRTLQPISRIVTEAERLDAAAMPEALLPEAVESDSEIGRLVIALNQMTTRLRQAFEVQRRFAEAQQRFAADASHELRTPLTILRGEMEVALTRQREPAVYQATLRSAIEEIGRMSRIVEGLGFLARQDAGQMTQARYMQPVNLTRLCRIVASEFEAMAADRSLHLETLSEKNAALTVIVCGDADQLHLLLRNLVDNAIKYTPSGGQVTISVETKENSPGAAGGVIVTVSDTGIGIAAEDLPFVFDRFWRADRARSSGGSGLGLSICRRIAEAHAGALTVESRLGCGTVFQLTLAGLYENTK